MPASVGLCARCTHASVQAGARGARFWRCLRADGDPAFSRYPALPVLACPGFGEGGKLGGNAATPRPRDPSGERGGR